MEEVNRGLGRCDSCQGVLNYVIAYLNKVNVQRNKF